MAIDDQLAVLLAQNADLFATYEEWANGQIMLLAGTIDDPNSFNEAGGKTGALGYYPVVNVSGQTIYVPSLARLRALALGGENAEGFEELVAQVGGKLAAVDEKITSVDQHLASKDDAIAAATVAAARLNAYPDAPTSLPLSIAQRAAVEAVAYVDFTSKPDGFPPGVLDTGQAADFTFNAGGRRAAISAGRLVVYNRASAGTGGLADYYQSDLSAPIVRIGCQWTQPSGSDDGNGNVTYAAWNGIYEGGGTVVPRSWVHMSIIPGTGAIGNAIWFIVRGVAGSQNILGIKQQTFTNPPADGLATWSSEAALDVEAGLGYASLPDGTQMTLSNAEIAAFCTAVGIASAPTFADLSATVAMCEHYCAAGADTAKFAGIKTLYAETLTSAARTFQSKSPTPREVFRRINAVRNLLPPATPSPVIYAPVATYSAATTTAMTNVDGTNAKLTASAGPTGKIIWRVSAYYEWTGTDTLFWRLAGSAGSTPVRAADVGVAGQKRVVQTTIETAGLIPFQSYTQSLQHSAVAGGLATLKAGGNGATMLPPITISATPA
jgi:hypothetical protein